MIGWGLLASLTGLIQTAAQFNIIRFLLGLAEGGLFPAVVVCLTHWFRQEDRTKAVAIFMAAIPTSNALGGIIAGQLLRLHWLGVPNWRWLLLLEGIPPVIGGIFNLFYLTDWPKEARWLSAGEREWITDAIEQENREKEKRRPPMSTFQAFGNPLVLPLAFSYFSMNAGGLRLGHLAAKDGPEILRHDDMAGGPGQLDSISVRDPVHAHHGLAFGQNGRAQMARNYR